MGSNSPCHPQDSLFLASDSLVRFGQFPPPPAYALAKNLPRVRPPFPSRQSGRTQNVTFPRPIAVPCSRAPSAMGASGLGLAIAPSGPGSFNAPTTLPRSRDKEKAPAIRRGLYVNARILFFAALASTRLTDFHHAALWSSWRSISSRQASTAALPNLISCRR